MDRSSTVVCIVGAVAAVLGAPAIAAPLILRDATVNVIDFGRISATPGQTYLGAFDVIGVVGVASNRNVDVECGIAVAALNCPAAGTRSTSYTATPFSVFPGITAASSATSEPNFQDSTARVTGTGTSAFTATSQSYQSWAVEGQQLRLNYSGGTAAFSVPLIMTYDLEALVEDRSAAALDRSLYSAFSSALINIVDSTTYVPPSAQSGAIDVGRATAALSIAFRAASGDLNLAGGSEDGTVGFMVRPNTNYWVQSEAANLVRFFGRPGGVSLAGLDVALFAAVDPVFSIDPVWIAANPELARLVSLSVGTIADPPPRVPEPGSLLLLTAGLAGMLVARRRRSSEAVLR